MRQLEAPPRALRDDMATNHDQQRRQLDEPVAELTTTQAAEKAEHKDAVRSMKRQYSAVRHEKAQLKQNLAARAQLRQLADKHALHTAELARRAATGREQHKLAAAAQDIQVRKQRAERDELMAQFTAESQAKPEGVDQQVAGLKAAQAKEQAEHPEAVQALQAKQTALAAEKQQLEQNPAARAQLIADAKLDDPQLQLRDENAKALEETDVRHEAELARKLEALRERADRGRLAVETELAVQQAAPPPPPQVCRLGGQLHPGPPIKQVPCVPSRPRHLHV